MDEWMDTGYVLVGFISAGFLQDADKKAASGVPDKSEARTGGTDKELRDIVLNFMIAGRDTTACALTWTLYELARVPDAQERLRTEFSAVFGGAVARISADDDSAAIEAAVSFDKVNQLSFAHAVATEVLRLHPSVPIDVKRAVKRDTLPDGTRVPAGAAIVYSPYAMGRDVRLWDEPLAFKPERFLSESGAFGEPSVWAYPTFNAGPRLCLGKPLAMMEIKLVTNMLLQSFDFSLTVPHDGGYESTLVLPMRPGLMVTLTPR